MGATVIFRLSTAAAGSAARPVTLSFAYNRPRSAPPVATDWYPRTAAVGTPLALTVRLAGVPDPDLSAPSPGVATGTAGGGWLPGVSVALTDPAGRPRPVAARLLWNDGAGGSSVSIAVAATNGGGESTTWDVAGFWSVMLVMELDSGGAGTAVASVAVIDALPPQARQKLQTVGTECVQRVSSSVVSTCMF